MYLIFPNDSLAFAKAVNTYFRLILMINSIEILHNENKTGISQMWKLYFNNFRVVRYFYLIIKELICTINIVNV